MFKKSLAHQSNATPLRSSARRQLVQAIFAQYPSLLGPQVGEGEASDGPTEKDLGKLVLPEGTRSCSFETSGAAEGVFYLNAEGDPLWMTLGRNSKEYIPTLYLLSLPLPYGPLPVLQIHNPLPPPLFTGAPLFVPAVKNLSMPHLIPDVPENGLVALVTSEANDKEVQYVGVGRIAAKGGVRAAVERRMNNLRDRNDVDEGKFCDILCIMNDHLWEMGSKPSLPTFTLPVPVNPLEAARGPIQPVAGPSRPTSPSNLMVQDVQKLEIGDNPPATTMNRTNLSPSDVSTLLSLALIQTLSTDSVPASSYPIPASQLYSAHILPNRPAYIPKEQRDDVVIGKSEWRKLAKWMKEASKDGLLKIKEVKGEAIIQSVVSTHPSLQAHAPYMTIAQEEVRAAKRAAREDAAAGTSSDAKGKGKQLQVEELWKPSGSAIPFWEAAGLDKSNLYPASVLKSSFDQYVELKKLVAAQNHRMLNLDKVLMDAVSSKKAEAQPQMPRDDVLRRLRDGVSWAVSINGVIKKGPLQPVSMSVKTRQGRKTVTLISGLETFGVDIDDFAEELRKLCAGSTSIQPLNGASPKLNLQEIMVQGSQVKIVTEALLSKGIPKRWIKEAEGDKKKK